MIELGEIQDLEVVRKTSVGVYLNSQDDEAIDSILLPQKQVPPETEVGDEIEVFVYRDSEDRMIATTRKPKLTMGALSPLKVVDITRIGAFLDWGLEKDLFLPFEEQTTEIQKGREYLVNLYIDKTDRLCATMDIYKYLSSESPYRENDRVRGIIYSIKNDMGAFVAIDNKYHGLIPLNELYGNYKCGDEVEVRVTKVREDGKLDLSLREKAHKQTNEDVKVILEKLKFVGGILPLDDHSSPDKIKDELNMSKSAFKRAVGRLLKERKIKLTEKGIELL